MTLFGINIEGDGKILLRAHCLNPDDEVTRGALADWLEENGASAKMAERIRRNGYGEIVEFHPEKFKIIAELFAD